MARFSRITVWNQMEETGLVPLFYNPDVEVSKKIVTALASGGATVIEFTNRGERAFELFRDLVGYTEKTHPDIIMGAGSVLDVATAGLYINLGANFIVGSVFNPDVALLCNRRKVVYCPGCGTASEVSAAEELGAEICKVFPAVQLGGPDFIQAIKAPCPWAKLMPTGGVDASEENLKSWFDAGAACVGIGTRLIRSDLIAAEDWDQLAALTARCLVWIREAKGKGQ